MKNIVWPSSLLLVLVTGPASAAPAVGTNELRLGQTFLPGLSMTGITKYEPTSSAASPMVTNDSLTLLSLGAGYGRFVTNHVELGGFLGYTSLDPGGGGAVSGPGLSPFVRLFGITGKIGYFGEAVFVFQALSSQGDSVTLYGGGVDGGTEFFLADSWALRVALTFRHLRAKASQSGQPSQPSEGLNAFGLNWAIAAYF